MKQTLYHEATTAGLTTQKFTIFFQNIIFFIVSDDPDWVKQNLESFEENIYFPGSVKQDLNDDNLMEDIEQRGTFKV